MNFKLYIILFWLAVLMTGTSCKKYLETKSDQKLSTPETLEDLEAILKNPQLKTAPQFILGAADEYYYAYNDWLARSEFYQKGYIWHPQLDNWQDWNMLYNTVFYANTVLYNLDNIPSSSEPQRWNQIKGTALFYRALSFYQVAQLYALQYDPSSASTDLGIPLRLDADFNKPSHRASLQETFDQIILDLQDAFELISIAKPVNKTNKIHPSRTAVLALQARVLLQMGNYSKAGEKAAECLEQHADLLDFNSTEVDPSSAIPIPLYNNEVIFHTSSQSSSLSDPATNIDTNVYRLFDEKDLRKRVFFLKKADSINYRFKGSYASGPSNLFNGLATDEVFLIRAECLARLGNTSAAMADLNALLVKRWEEGAFVPLTADSPAEALQKVLLERRKELLCRGIRWSDLKRLNKEPGFAVSIKRVLGGETYTLPPDDLRYALLIPLEVMNTAKLQQNAR